MSEQVLVRWKRKSCIGKMFWNKFLLWYFVSFFYFLEWASRATLWNFANLNIWVTPLSVFVSLEVQSGMATQNGLGRARSLAFFSHSLRSTIQPELTLQTLWYDMTCFFVLLREFVLDPVTVPMNALTAIVTVKKQPASKQTIHHQLYHHNNKLHSSIAHIPWKHITHTAHAHTP